MHTYLINLDRSPDRLDSFKSQFETLGLLFERVPAVEGAAVPVEEAVAIKADRFEFQPINAAELGVFLSHRECWKRLVSEEVPHAAVFEDDVVFSEFLPEVYDVLDAQSFAYDVVKLETTLRRVAYQRQSISEGSCFSVNKLLSWHGGAAGYVIARSAAERLLDLTEKVADPVDHVLFNPMSSISRTLDIYQLTPGACVQHDMLDSRQDVRFGTTIDRSQTTKSLFRHGPVTDFKRLVKRQVESSRRFLLSQSQKNVVAHVPFANGQQLQRAS